MQLSASSVVCTTSLMPVPTTTSEPRRRALSGTLLSCRRLPFRAFSSCPWRLLPSVTIFLRLSTATSLGSVLDANEYLKGFSVARKDDLYFVGRQLCSKQGRKRILHEFHQPVRV